MTDQNITGVLLAAGKGTRMHPFSTNYPKPILPVGNRPLLCHQIEFMRKLGINDIIVVIGHLGFEITRILGDGSSLGVRIKYIEQKETLGIAHAVGQLEPHIHSPFLLFLGDIFFISKNMDTMIKTFHSNKSSAVLAVKEETDNKEIMKNFSVLMDESGVVKRVTEKPRFIHSNLKGCGIYLFRETIFDAIRRTPRTAMRDEYEITNSIQILIEDGYLVNTASVIEEDINLTTPLDLLKCNMKLLALEQKNNIIATNGDINKGAEIINSVIGNNVIIKHPVTIKDSVIFNDSEISVNKNLQNIIITPDNLIDCRHYI